jgi:AraC family transcriptional regulator of arabinose operon
VIDLDSRILFQKSDELDWLPFYVTTLGYWRHQTEMGRPTGFPDYQFHQILNGQGKLKLEGEEFILGRGDVFFLYPDIAHQYEPISEPWELAWVSFNGREVSPLLSKAGINKPGVSRLKGERLMHALREMLMLEESSVEDIDIERSKLIYQLLLDLGQQLILPSSADADKERLRPVLRYIDQHLHESVTLQELAEVASVSPQYLCRLFQRILKVRPMTYINQERINKSKQLMYSHRSKRMYEIARMVGFEHPSYYCAVFKRHTGMTPEQFKALHGIQS